MPNDPRTIYPGSKQLTIKDEALNITFPVLVHYPTYVPSAPVAFGPYTMEVSLDAPVCEGMFPLVLISHGNGGTHLGYRTISRHLAKNGYIVAMPEHFGNNRNNNQWENTTENLLNRPRHISLAIDSLLANETFGHHIAKEKIAVIGHSMGGYTALALAGGIPRTKEGMVINTKPDERIKTIALLAPGAGWFYKGLEKIVLPILLIIAEHDPVTPGWNADIILNGVPDPSQVTFYQVENAGHFSFLSPFPEQMKTPQFMPATDPKGFDRNVFHQQLPMQINEFLDKQFR